MSTHATGRQAALQQNFYSMTSSLRGKRTVRGAAIGARPASPLTFHDLRHGGDAHAGGGVDEGGSPRPKAIGCGVLTMGRIPTRSTCTSRFAAIRISYGHRLMQNTHYTPLSSSSWSFCVCFEQKAGVIGPSALTLYGGSCWATTTLKPPSSISARPILTASARLCVGATLGKHGCASAPRTKGKTPEKIHEAWPATHLKGR